MNLRLAYCTTGIILACIPAILSATQLVTGPATLSDPLYTFTKTVTQKVYCRASGTLYLGLEATDSDYSIWAATRPIGSARPTFEEITGDNPIRSLTLVSNFGNPQPYLAYTEYADSTAPTTIEATNYKGGHKGTSADLKDAAGNTTTEIIALSGMLLPTAKNKGYVFAAVAPTSASATQTFGASDSGIAVLSLTDTLSTIKLYQTAANSETPTIVAAQRLDPSSETVLIQAEPTIDNFATLYWDDQIERLYVGLQLTTSSGTNDGAKAIVVGHVQQDGSLTFYNIAPDAAFQAGDMREIVGAVTTGTAVSVAIVHIRTMHCSTGPSYLIVNGGVGTKDTVNNLIYALPIVDTCPEQAIQGTLAYTESTLSDKNHFVTPVTAYSQMALATEPSVQVGAGPLPIQASTPISDIEIIGDTVYVSIATAQSSTDENGILYSQALFDKTGKVVRWTPWTKRAFPTKTFSDTASIDEGVEFFAVDAVTSKVWAVDGNTKKVVRVTAWDKGTSNCTLPARLCESLQCGCYSILDLDQATRGFTTHSQTAPYTPNRFALFGGCGKVVIAQTSVAYTQTMTSPQIVIEDYCPNCAVNYYLETTLPYPDTQFCVNVLEYSRTNTDSTHCYFFAGTDNGLYVYCNSDGTGFTLPELTIETLEQGIWAKVPTFTDPIIDIKTTGLSLYIVSRSVKKGSMISKVSRVDFQDTWQDMFNQTFTIAMSGEGIFEHAPAFTGIQPVAVQVDDGQLVAEQLVLATNDGLFGSNAALASFPQGIADATTQQEAAWSRIPKNNSTFFDGIAGIDTPIPTTVWPISVEDLHGASTYQYSWIYQISSRMPSGTESFFGTFVPPFFNAITHTQAFEQIDPIFNFWSDGARRFFVINRSQDSATRNRLMSFPFNTLEWRVSAPGRTVLLFDPYVTATKRFFWVKQIGITGILMAGTNNGIIALE